MVPFFHRLLSQKNGIFTMALYDILLVGDYNSTIKYKYTIYCKSFEDD